MCSADAESCGTSAFVGGWSGSSGATYLLFALAATAKGEGTVGALLVVLGLREGLVCVVELR